MTTDTATSDVGGLDGPSWRDRARVNRTTIGVLAAAVTVYLISLALVPQFATVEHLGGLLALSGYLGILALGEGVVILGGGIDLSLANIVTAVGVFAATLSSAGLPSGLVVLASLALGALIGIVNGVGVAYVGVPPLVMTLASGSITQGLTLVSTNGTPHSGAPHMLRAVANHRLFAGVTGTVVVWIVVAVLCSGYLNRFRAGRYLYAVGTNPRVARLSGLPVRAVTAGTYVIAGLTAAVVGCLLVGYTGIATATMGDDYLLPAIAAVVIGGASILGGSGTALGITLGAFLLTIVEGLLTVVNVNSAGREMLEGAILLAVVVAYNLRNVRRSSR